MTTSESRDNTAPPCQLERGRELFRDRAWAEAYAVLAAAAEREPMHPRDVELIATAAYVLGRDVESDAALERAYRDHLERGDLRGAARCAFWLGISLIMRGEPARGGGWLGRAHDSLDDAPEECAERGLLLVPGGLQALGERDFEAALAAFSRAGRIASLCGDADLAALSSLGQGQALIQRGDVRQGMEFLDSAMVAVTTGDVSIIPSGIIYCAVLIECRRILDLRRSQEWTAAMSRWCGSQPDLVLYRGQCLVHRSEILQWHGQWAEAMDEARRAVQRLAKPWQPAVGMAYYQLAELHRLRGDHSAAEQAYHLAVEHGQSPQPGLALLRRAQGNLEAAKASLRRVLDETEDPPARARLLAAQAEVMLAAGGADSAREAADELAGIADAVATPLLVGLAAQSDAAVLLAEGKAAQACRELQSALRAWQELGAPYEAARAHALLARACWELGDTDTARLELEAARTTFSELGAAQDLAVLADARNPGDLSPRENEVLAHIAAGLTNKDIATRLVLSEKTVERHVSSILGKLGVPNRSAATAYAFQHGLVR
ncbi:helix-turn-helix transcriptional regulator [Lolliginicoccus suaedae]|uniref:helix-turn-helix transcriptional regulator n=1 Tax=Lolliginicoccus suaedae TaxID=2605429 RepID=UPI001F45AFD1|nr:helix-turn-helix transcriptional regulator [Lolliginicoccus suaedae]